MSFWFLIEVEDFAIHDQNPFRNFVNNSKFLIFLAFDSTGTKWILVILKSYLLYFDTAVSLSLGFIADLRDQIVD